uniref:Secreted protein n=1 Tax=Aegilops tauschii TaxID=37682 RepID=M8B5Y8_AEGTA
MAWRQPTVRLLPPPSAVRWLLLVAPASPSPCTAPSDDDNRFTRYSTTAGHTGHSGHATSSAIPYPQETSPSYS